MAFDINQELTRELLTVPQAAERLGIQPATVRQQIAAGRLQATKLGVQWLIAADEVERYRRDSLGQPGAPVKPRKRRRTS